MSSKKNTIEGRVERKKRRAIELYDADSPFKQKIVERKDAYKRKPKHKNSFLTQKESNNEQSNPISSTIHPFRC